MCSMKISEASQKFMKMKDTLCKELLGISKILPM